ncbi:MAG: hypothetical protein R6V12_08990 [Candidatus Hydrogenedentota bacterium]
MMNTRFLFIAIALLGFAMTASAAFQAGVAVRDVTPDPLLPVSGGASPTSPATEQKGNLTVRALVFENHDERVAIVGADFLGFPGALCDRVRAKVRGIPPENILIGSTHTHSAPDMYGFPDGKGGHGANLEYIAMVVDRMAEAINQAVADLEPASLKIDTGEAKGKIAYNYYAPQLYDPRCHVIQAVGEDGNPIATLINYAIHPEIIGPDQGILSPDLCGPLYDRVAQKGGGTAVFMNSAQGGMVTADCRGPDGKDVQTWEECHRIGNLLADEALRIVSDAPIQEAPELYCTAEEVSFEVDSEEIRQIAAHSPIGMTLNPDNTVTTQINLLNIGNAQAFTIPGEALPNIGYYLKRNMNGEHNFLFGLTNDAYGYIMTKVDWNSFKRYEYISGLNLGEYTGERLIEECLALVESSPKPESLAQKVD